jgi:hypothetical protein
MATVSAYIAYKRDKNPYFWFVIGAIFGVFGIFAVFFLPKKKPEEPKAPVEPVFYIDGPTDKFWYYLDAKDENQGPMSRDALSDAWKSGIINLSTYVWHEELDNWKFLKETLKEMH